MVRAMPNICAKVGESVSFLCKGRYVTAQDLKVSRMLFSSVGEVFLTNERLLDRVTSVSGSGPGYIYYFMDCMYRKARDLQFRHEEAKRMIIHTFLGAARLACVSGKDFNTLLGEVASAKGTTQAALNVFRKKRFSKTISSGMDAALRRAREISCQYSKR